MSEATQKMRDFLTKSPSVVYPDDVLRLFEPVERENEKLRELIADMRKAFIHNDCHRWCDYMPERCYRTCQYLRRMRELGIEIGEKGGERWGLR